MFAYIEHNNIRLWEVTPIRQYFILNVLFLLNKKTES